MGTIGALHEVEDYFLVDAIGPHDDVAFVLPSLYHLLGVALVDATIIDQVVGGELIGQRTVAHLHLLRVMPFLSRTIESLFLHPEVRLPVVAEEVVLAAELDVAHQLAEVEICVVDG